MAAGILALNAGSSSLKFALYEGREGLPLVLKGGVSYLHSSPRLRFSSPGGAPGQERSLGKDRLDIVSAVEIVAAEIRNGSGGGSRAQDRPWRP